jgi:hypothetical protein
MGTYYKHLAAKRMTYIGDRGCFFRAAWTSGMLIFSAVCGADLKLFFEVTDKVFVSFRWDFPVLTLRIHWRRVATNNTNEWYLFIVACNTLKSIRRRIISIQKKSH